MPGRANYLFDKTTGKETTLASLISISEEELNQKVRGLFQEQVKGNTEGFFEDAEETLNNKTDFIDNYYFSEDGVVFYATPYEIAPYAAAIPRLRFLLKSWDCKKKKKFPAYSTTVRRTIKRQKQIEWRYGYGKFIRTRSSEPAPSDWRL